MVAMGLHQTSPRLSPSFHGLVSPPGHLCHPDWGEPSARQDKGTEKDASASAGSRLPAPPRPLQGIPFGPQGAPAMPGRAPAHAAVPEPRDEQGKRPLPTPAKAAPSPAVPRRRSVINAVRVTSS